MLNVYEQVDRNKRKSDLIMACFVVFVTLVVWVFARAWGADLSVVGLALVFSGLMTLSGYYWGDRLILKISGARPASREKYFTFYTVAENLAMAASLPRPKLYVIDDTAMNAFATGRDPEHAVVCATTGLINRLNRTELEGVIAHELSHVKNYDIRLMSIVTVLVGVVALLADWFLRGSSFGVGRRRSRDDDTGGQLQAVLMVAALVLAVLAPLFANLIKLAISRRREFLADASAVKLTRQPSGLINALRKLSQDREPLEVANRATAHLYIVNPLRNLSGGMKKMALAFSTHPPIEERIKALEAMR